ncbi:MAG: hypothetical protein MZV49_06370 [Rhodopseudomonas palustris]|nr:hypothetical protein [Rhodopseudomonas palustris]
MKEEPMAKKVKEVKAKVVSVTGTCELSTGSATSSCSPSKGVEGRDLHPRPLQHDAEGLRHDVQRRFPLGQGPPRHADPSVPGRRQSGRLRAHPSAEANKRE